MTIKSPWVKLREEEAFDCPYFTVRRDLVTHGSGPPLLYSSVRTKVFGVGIVPIDADGCTTLVGQYRYVIDKYSWEVPGGGGSHGRPPLEAARDELSEETGLSAARWLKIMDASVAPGTSDSFFKGFVAWELEQGLPHPEPEESLLLNRLPFLDAVDMAISGGLDNLATVALLLALHARFKSGDLPADLSRLMTRRR